MTVRSRQVRTLNGQREPGNVSYLYGPADPAVAEVAAELDTHWSPQIIGERASRIYFLDARDVEYLASAGNYVTTHVGGAEFLTRATLKSMATLLAPLGFMQIERSLLVNLRQVAHVERLDRGKYCFVMRNGEHLVSSRERSGTIRALLLGATSPVRL